MWIDIASYVESQKAKRLADGRPSQDPNDFYEREFFEWQAIQPNPVTSEPITKTLFFGRAILVPGNRVFVISGSLSNKVTNKVSDEVQEWNLEDYTVRRCQRIPYARTSFACYYHDRYIFVVGGNLAHS